jgi:hypothetical protein
MASIVLIETNGTVKTLKAKELSLETLSKKCGFRVNDDFLCRHTWHVSLPIAEQKKEMFHVSVWAKKTGKANFENKYDFPPPIDKDLYFGTCAIVRQAEDGTFLDLTKEVWLKIYEKLFGGFEDIGDEDEYSEDELANVDPSLLTANGYLKDGFVVSDKECISTETTSVDTSEEEPVSNVAIGPIKTSTPIKKKRVVTKKSKVLSASGAGSGSGSGGSGAGSGSGGGDLTVEKKTIKKKSVSKKTEVEAEKEKEKETKVKTKGKGDKIKVKEIEPESEPNKEESEGTTSELEEEGYIFSDDD